MNKNLFIWLLPLGLIQCNSIPKSSSGKTKAQVVSGKYSLSQGFMPGIPAYGDSRFDYKAEGKEILSVRLKEPVVVSVAAKPEKWGFFQFPTMLRMPDGSIGIKWSLNIDAIEAYGRHEFGSAVSTDGGTSWQASEVKESSGSLLLENGDQINVLTPKPIKVEDIELPPAVGKGMDTYARTAYTFYKLHDLPEIRQGVYINRLKKDDTEWRSEKDKLNDPQAARYSFRGLFPIVWWGDMHIASDHSIIAGMYPGFYMQPDGNVDPRSGAFFYRSTDNGHTWNIQGRVRYIPDLNLDSLGNRRMGFTEPAFEILSDGTFLCVLRTTDGVGIGPMYASRSHNLGKTWSKPEIIAPSGVLPRLLQLDNGITVLASGRPGVQLRFSTGADAKQWTDPFEMLPYKNKKDQVSCGYTGLLATGPDSFLIVYSDFNYKNEKGEIRKAIKVREVVVEK